MEGSFLTAVFSVMHPLETWYGARMDDTPYIIVDNQKISPIARVQHRERSPDATDEPNAASFGVVDRVTISDEARARAELARTDRTPPDQDQVESVLTSAPLLTYSPKRRWPGSIR
jgi:hypothetical protein